MADVIKVRKKTSNSKFEIRSAEHLWQENRIVEERRQLFETSRNTHANEQMACRQTDCYTKRETECVGNCFFSH